MIDKTKALAGEIEQRTRAWGTVYDSTSVPVKVAMIRQWQKDLGFLPGDNGSAVCALRHAHDLLSQQAKALFAGAAQKATESGNYIDEMLKAILALKGEEETGDDAGKSAQKAFGDPQTVLAAIKRQANSIRLSWERGRNIQGDVQFMMLEIPRLFDYVSEKRGEIQDKYGSTQSENIWRPMLDANTSFWLALNTATSYWKMQTGGAFDNRNVQRLRKKVSQHMLKGLLKIAQAEKNARRLKMRHKNTSGMQI